MTTAADLLFDAETHVYRHQDGRVVPNVTTILKDVGAAVDFDELADISSRLADQIEFRRQLGAVVHQDAHAFDDDDLIWASVDAAAEPYVRAWETFRANTGLTPLTRERRVFHPGLFYAGTLDGIFAAPGGGRVLVDLKIGDPEASACRFQTAAYWEAYRVEHCGHDHTLPERWGVQLLPDRQVPYRISVYKDWRDFTIFQAFLVTFNHQAARRRPTA